MRMEGCPSPYLFAMVSIKIDGHATSQNVFTHLGKQKTLEGVSKDL